MLSRLMQINSAQDTVIQMQAGIIDELFTLVCHYANAEDIDGMEPLLCSIKDAVEISGECRR